MPKRKVTVKILNEKFKALKEIEKGLSNKETSVYFDLDQKKLLKFIKPHYLEFFKV